MSDKLISVPLDFSLGEKVQVHKAGIAYIRGCLFYPDENAWHYAIGYSGAEIEEVWCRASELKHLEQKRVYTKTA